jgi:hypothetical protein
MRCVLFCLVDHELGYAIMGEMQLLQEHIYFGRIDAEEPVRTLRFLATWQRSRVVWLAVFGSILAKRRQASG